MVKRSKELPANSLPLRYQLLPSLSNSSPCSCITTNLPFRDHSSSLNTSNTDVRTEDIRDGSSRAGVEIVRILDPEHREPFVSLSRIFLACSVSILEGIMTYKLRRPDFDSSLAGIAPFKDIWVNLITARKIATDLNVIDELAGFLGWESRLAWSVEDKEVGGLIHNWKISNEHILPDDYSTNSMLATSFSRLHLLPKGNQVRTLLPENSSSIAGSSTASLQAISFSNASFPTTWESLHSKVVEWSIHEFETYLSLQEEQSTNDFSFTDSDPIESVGSRLNDDNVVGEMALTLGSIFTTSIAFLSITKSLPSGSLPSTDSPGSTLLIGSLEDINKASSTSAVNLAQTNSSSLPSKSKEENFLRLEKSVLVSLASSGIIKEKKLHIMNIGVLGLCEFMNRLVVKEWRREEELRIAEKRSKKGITSSSPVPSNQDKSLELGLASWINLDERIRKLEEQELKQGERTLSSRSIDISTLEEQNQKLTSKVQELALKIQALEFRSLELSEVNDVSRKEKLNFEEERAWISARELNFMLGIFLLGLIGVRINDYLT